MTGEGLRFAQPVLRGHYQNAYVTRDLEKAKAIFEGKFGVGNWLTSELDMELKTPEGTRPTRLGIAMGWDGGCNIELIEPRAGYCDYYREYLPAMGAAPRFHHIGMRRDDLPAMRAEIARLGLNVICEGETPAFVFIYLDARGVLGHYLEYVWAVPEVWPALGWPEGRPVL